MKGKHKNFTNAMKVKVVLEVLRGQKTMTAIASEYGIHPNQLTKWKKQVLSGLPDLFNTGKNRQDIGKDELITELYQQIGQMKVELDWLKKKSELIY